MKTWSGVVLGLTIVGFARGAGAQHFHSGPAAVPLLELFTSEGCSSCPPAERWLGELRHDAGLWQEFVPIAWHVNYWDRLGWPDRFAARAYTDRQYAYAAAWRSGSVYTPAFVRAGAEWRQRSRADLGRAEAAAPKGELSATVGTDGWLEVSFTPVPPRTGSAPAPERELQAHVALLGGGIVSDVKRGENQGRRLEHEFVVLATVDAPLPHDRARVPLPAAPADLIVPRLALAVWVTAGADLAPVQATGGWLQQTAQPSG